MKSNSQDDEVPDQLLERVYSDAGFQYHQTIMRYRLIYSIGGLFLGLSCIIGGVILFLRGVTGATSWTARFIGASSQVSDAAPGAVLFIVGLFLVWVTRYRSPSISSAGVSLRRGRRSTPLE